MLSCGAEEERLSAEVCSNGQSELSLSRVMLWYRLRAVCAGMRESSRRARASNAAVNGNLCETDVVFRRRIGKMNNMSWFPLSLAGVNRKHMLQSRP